MLTASQFNLKLIAADVQAAGIVNATALARKARCAVPTITRFFGEGPRTLKTLQKIARALGQDHRRYLKVRRAA